MDDFIDPAPAPEEPARKPKAKKPAEQPATAPDAEKDALLARIAELEAMLAAKAPAPASAAPPPAGDASLPLWSVTYQCPTPLAFRTLEIRAADMHQAKLEYCKRNNISEGQHPWQVALVGGNG